MEELNKKPENKNIENAREYIKKKHLYIILSVLFVFISLLLAVWIYSLQASLNNRFSGLLKKISPEFSGENIRAENEAEDKTRRLIDGLPVNQGTENLFPFAFMIDNHVDARPPSALARAQIVFESEAEGGITRYLAIFAANDNLEKIGPIRSARSYFIDWAREFSALYIHVGGSPEALVKLKKENILHVNEFFNEKYFWRDKTQTAPHNVYSSLELMRKYVNDNNTAQGDYFGWLYKEEKPSANQDKNLSIKINFSRPSYIVEWKYDPMTNSFKRYLDSSIHKTAENEEIIAKNVVIQYVDSMVIDDELRLEVENIGSGGALFCLDGGCADAYWQKKNPHARTRFYAKNIDSEEFGAELEFNPGSTWIEAISPEVKVDTY